MGLGRIYPDLSVHLANTKKSDFKALKTKILALGSTYSFDVIDRDTFSILIHSLSFELSNISLTAANYTKSGLVLSESSQTYPIYLFASKSV